jgi:hypothetical protein
MKFEDTEDASSDTQPLPLVEQASEEALPESTGEDHPVLSACACESWRPG